MTDTDNDFEREERFVPAASLMEEPEFNLSTYLDDGFYNRADNGDRVLRATGGREEIIALEDGTAFYKVSPGDYIVVSEPSDFAGLWIHSYLITEISGQIIAAPTY